MKRAYTVAATLVVISTAAQSQMFRVAGSAGEKCQIERNEKVIDRFVIPGSDGVTSAYLASIAPSSPEITVTCSKPGFRTQSRTVGRILGTIIMDGLPCSPPKDATEAEAKRYCEKYYEGDIAKVPMYPGIGFWLKRDDEPATTQPDIKRLDVVTDPGGAACTFERDGRALPIARVSASKTRVYVDVSESPDSIGLTCTLAGYHTLSTILAMLRRPDENSPESCPATQVSEKAAEECPARPIGQADDVNLYYAYPALSTYHLEPDDK
jgi:hypothetical protein